jgi:hypothetical protein
LAFHGPDGARHGYIGYSDANYVYVQQENARRWRFSHRPLFGLAEPYDTANLTPFDLTKINVITAGQSAAEGGEFHLAKPTTNTTLAGNVAIDIAGDSLRIYETGGTFRGVYLPITEQGSQSRLLTDANVNLPTLQRFMPNGTWTRHQTSHGYIDFGPVNASYAHIYTDMPSFYFNKGATFASGGVLVASGNITNVSGGFVSAQPTGNVHLRMKDANNATGVSTMLYKDTGNFYFLLTDDNAADGGYNGLRPLRIGLRDGYVAMSNGVEVRNGLSVYDGLAVSGNLTGATILGTAAGNGNGVRFWAGNAAYSVYMSSSADPTWGGRAPGEGTSDYNMYFRMAAGTNRGFVFLNDRTPVAGIDASGIFRNANDLHVGAELYINGGWVRVGGNSGLYFSTHGGGWHMTDSSWIRAYQNKHIVTTGTMQMGAFTVTSDIRLKTDIVPITNAADIIDATNVYEFTKGGKRMYGMIAQEARAVAPILVSDSADLHPEDGDPILALDQTGYIPLLIDEVKALRMRVRKLEGMVA